MAHADGQGAVGVTICDKPFPLDFDHEVEEAGNDLIGYAGVLQGEREMRLLLTGLVAVATLLRAPAMQAKDWNKVMSFGAGESSCGTWTATRKADNTTAQVMESWVLGFVTASELWSPQDLKDTDSAGLAGQIDLYCAAHPLDKVLDASMDLVKKISPTAKPAQ